MTRAFNGFKRLSRERWLYLGLFFLALLYLIFVLWGLYFHGVFEYTGVDYRTMLSSAQIIRDHGFAAIYDLGLQKEYQLPLYRYSPVAAQVPMEVNLMLYLPVFTVPFLLFLPFDPPASFGVYTLVNVVIFLLYLRRLFKEAGWSGPWLLVAGFALCLPTVFTLFFGQLNVWLLICFGESFIAFRHGRDGWGGVWLAGWLVKPQLLILFIPALLIGKKWRALFGLGLASVVILAASFVLVGADGLFTLARWMIGSADPQGLPTNFPEFMMNWRALGLIFNALSPVTIGWGITAVGMAVTALIGLGLWLFRIDTMSSAFAKIWLGTYAATCVVTWHSHVYTALPMLAPMVFVLANARVPRSLLLWLYAPAALFLGIFWIYTPIVVMLGVRTVFAGPNFAQIMAGFSLFIVNLVIVVWVLRSLIEDRIPWQLYKIHWVRRPANAA